MYVVSSRPSDARSTAAVQQRVGYLGDRSEGLRHLQAAYDQRDGAVMFVETDPEFKSLHDEPAYRDLLARMNLPVPSMPQD